MVGSKLTISKAQIQAAGDATITWLESKLGSGWLVQKILEFARGEWDTVGVTAVAQILTDLGWTVTD